MLKVTVHSGLLSSRSAANQLAVLDIAYPKKSALADYVAALSLRGSGEVALAFVRDYPFGRPACGTSSRALWPRRCTAQTTYLPAESLTAAAPTPPVSARRLSA